MGAYVEQEDDYHLPVLTVDETLRMLRYSDYREQCRGRTKLRAEVVMHMLGLDDCADSLVGSTHFQRLRLSLAVEMINDPAVVIVGTYHGLRSDA